MLSFGAFTQELENDPSLAEGYFRFRRSVNLIPGVKANITSSGLSGITIGKKGKKPLFAINHRGIRRSFKIRTGLSFIATSSGKAGSGVVKAKKIRPSKNIK
jgi:hypothetical protein